MPCQCAYRLDGDGREAACSSQVFVFSDPSNDDLPGLRRARKFRPEKMSDLTEKYIRRKIPTNIAGVSSGA
jgi:hypothetical protein